MEICLLLLITNSVWKQNGKENKADGRKKQQKTETGALVPPTGAQRSRFLHVSAVCVMSRVHALPEDNHPAPDKGHLETSRSTGFPSIRFAYINSSTSTSFY
jgi:hypothetical protein